MAAAEGEPPQEQHKEVEEGLGGEVALEAALPNGGHAGVLGVGHIIPGPIHVEVMVEGGDQGDEGVHLKQGALEGALEEAEDQQNLDRDGVGVVQEDPGAPAGGVSGCSLATLEGEACLCVRR